MLCEDFGLHSAKVRNMFKYTNKISDDRSHRTFGMLGWQENGFLGGVGLVPDSDCEK